MESNAEVNALTCITHGLNKDNLMPELFSSTHLSAILPMIPSKSSSVIVKYLANKSLLLQTIEHIWERDN